MSGAFGEHHSDGPECTERIAQSLARELEPGDVLALRGDLGAGKTRFVRGLAQGLGHNPDLVSSPTYILVHEYDTPGAASALVHIDAYRLSGADDLDSIDWESLIGGEMITAIEWPERVGARLPGRRVEVFIDHAGPTRRTISISRVGHDRLGCCRTCGAPFSPSMAASGAVFCSSKCRMADLGKWFNGEYTVSRDLKESDIEEGE